MLFINDLDWNSANLGPFSRNMPKALWWSLGGGAISHERGTPVRLAPMRVGLCWALGVMRPPAPSSGAPNLCNWLI